MKQCPQCNREYDNSMMYCLDDGAELLYGPSYADGPVTAISSEPLALAGSGRRDRVEAAFRFGRADAGVLTDAHERVGYHFTENVFI